MATDNYMYKEERIITDLCKYTARKNFLVKAYNLQINLLSIYNDQLNDFIHVHKKVNKIYICQDLNAIH